MKKNIKHRFVENEARMMSFEDEIDRLTMQNTILVNKVQELERMLKFCFLIDEIRRDYNLFQALGVVADEFCFYDKRERIDEQLARCEKFEKMIPKDVKEYFNDTGDKEDIAI